MCKNITKKYSKCGHDEVHGDLCSEVRDGGLCGGKQEELDTNDEKKCPDCEHFDNALLQIATNENLAPHKPATTSGPVYTGPTMWHIRRFRWKHCRHVIDYWTDQECYDPKLVYLEEAQNWACDKCAEAHPSTLEWMRKQGKLDIDDPWGLSIQDPTDHPKLRGDEAPRPPSPPSAIQPPPATAPVTHPPPVPISLTRPPPITVPPSPPTENSSLYSLTPPPASPTSFHPADDPTAPTPPAPPAMEEPPESRSDHAPGYTQPAHGGMRRPPPRLLPTPAAVPVPFEDLSDSDGEGDDPERPAVFALASIAPPRFVSTLPPRAGRPAHEHEGGLESEAVDGAAA